jgi:hypothetical protein
LEFFFITPPAFTDVGGPPFVWKPPPSLYKCDEIPQGHRDLGVGISGDFFGQLRNIPLPYKRIPKLGIGGLPVFE